MGINELYNSLLKNGLIEIRVRPGCDVNEEIKKMRALAEKFNINVDFFDAKNSASSEDIQKIISNSSANIFGKF